MKINKTEQIESDSKEQSSKTKLTFSSILFGLMALVCLFSVSAKPDKSERPKRKLAVKKKESRNEYEAPHLYDSLIRNMIGVHEDAETTHFKDALMSWQRINGLPVSGLVDNATWVNIKSILQSKRIKDKQPPISGSLIQIAEINLYDSQRPEELRYVEHKTYTAYQQMVEAARNAPELKSFLATNDKYLTIISAYRSPEYQAELRRANPGAGRGALALNSPHSTGRTIDIYVGGDPVSTKYPNRVLQMNTPVYKWLVKNASRFGFAPYYYEPWHWEYIKN